MNETSFTKIETLEKEVNDKIALHQKINILLTSLNSKPKFNNFELEKAAIDLQNLMWIHRNVIWAGDVPDHPIKVLKACLVLKKALGYKYSLTDSLEVNHDNFDSKTEIAGIIDKADKIVLVSKKFNKNIQNFTAAHELGHALLHKQIRMHRDKPLDGVLQQGKRSLQEIQADKFATFFLMPSKMVKQTFSELFNTEKFLLNENTAFFLTSKTSADKLRAECKNLRGLALKLASAERYDNQSFKSIAELFTVSVTAMAIRLEELDLLEF